MNANELERLMRSDGGVPGGAWPPRSEVVRWTKVGEFRARYRNDAHDLFRYRTALHVPDDAEATAKRMRDFCPLPITRELARFSAQLLLSDEPDITGPDGLKAWAETNRLHEFLQAAGELVAATGEIGVRIVKDDRVSRSVAVITAEPADRVIWAERHGRLTDGGAVVVEVEAENNVRYRLLEHHGPGYVRRALFKGGIDRLGTRVGLQSRPEFRDLRPYEETGLSRPTLVRWKNVADGTADIAGLESILDAADEAETVFRVKSRASRPLTFAHRRLADKQGDADLDGVILLGDDQVSPVEAPEELARVVQGRMESEDHERYVKHLRELALTGAGYSLSSWGLDHGGVAESGRALRLRQSRTLQTLAGKKRMAERAIAEIAEISLDLMRPGSRGDARVEVKLGTGMPEDRQDLAEELAMLRSADAISTRQAVRELHPDWTDAQVDEEARRIEPPAPGVGEFPRRLPPVDLDRDAS